MKGGIRRKPGRICCDSVEGTAAWQCEMAGNQKCRGEEKQGRRSRQKRRNSESSFLDRLLKRSTDRFTLAISSIVEKYNFPFEDDKLISIKSLTYDTPDGPKAWGEESEEDINNSDVSPEKQKSMNSCEKSPSGTDFKNNSEISSINRYLEDMHLKENIHLGCHSDAEIDILVNDDAYTMVASPKVLRQESKNVHEELVNESILGYHAVVPRKQGHNRYSESMTLQLYNSTAKDPADELAASGNLLFWDSEKTSCNSFLEANEDEHCSWSNITVADLYPEMVKTVSKLMHNVPYKASSHSQIKRYGYRYPKKPKFNAATARLRKLESLKHHSVLAITKENEKFRLSMENSGINRLLGHGNNQMHHILLNKSSVTSPSCHNTDEMEMDSSDSEDYSYVDRVGQNDIGRKTFHLQSDLILAKRPKSGNFNFPFEDDKPKAWGEEFEEENINNSDELPEEEQSMNSCESPPGTDFKNNSEISSIKRYLEDMHPKENIHLGWHSETETVVASPRVLRQKSKNVQAEPVNETLLGYPAVKSLSWIPSSSEHARKGQNFEEHFAVSPDDLGTTFDLTEGSENGVTRIMSSKAPEYLNLTQNSNTNQHLQANRSSPAKSPYGLFRKHEHKIFSATGSLQQSQSFSQFLSSRSRVKIEQKSEDAFEKLYKELCCPQLEKSFRSSNPTQFGDEILKPELSNLSKFYEKHYKSGNRSCSEGFPKISTFPRAARLKKYEGVQVSHTVNALVNSPVQSLPMVAKTKRIASFSNEDFLSSPVKRLKNISEIFSSRVHQ